MGTIAKWIAVVCTLDLVRGSSDAEGSRGLGVRKEFCLGLQIGGIRDEVGVVMGMPFQLFNGNCFARQAGYLLSMLFWMGTWTPRRSSFRTMQMLHSLKVHQE